MCPCFRRRALWLGYRANRKRITPKQAICAQRFQYRVTCKYFGIEIPGLLGKPTKQAGCYLDLKEALLGHPANNCFGGIFSGFLDCVDPNLSIVWRFIRAVEACEILDLSGAFL